jgi:N-acyl-D-amino-acid deacylase
MHYDTIISNGRVFDGSGESERRIDIGLKGDQIEQIGALSHDTADNRIDATNAIVCPGFIDAHSHSDVYLLLEPSAASKLYQGVTTEICGNCGASAAPLLEKYNLPSDWQAQLNKANGALPPTDPKTRSSVPPAPAPWSTVADYHERFKAAQPAINAALLIGHNTLHAGVCGYEPRAATSGELRRMIRSLEQAFEEGAIGISSGLVYPPGSAVPQEELIELTKVAAKYDGRYTTHMRSETARLLEAIDEAIHIAEQAGARLQISHLKTGNRDAWNKLPRALEKIDSASKHIAIGADRYPYLAGCTDLDIVLPDWASHGGRPVVLERIRNPKTREKIRAELLGRPDGYWNHVMIGSTTFEKLKGEYLPDAARSLGMNEVDALLHLIDTDELTTGGIFFGMSEENMWTILADPRVSIGSDASLRAPWGPLASDHPHPRAYGTFTRFLRAALDNKIVNLPEAIRKMTALPAEQFGLKKRGLLKKGYFADILIIDPTTTIEKSTYKDPHRLSEGMKHIFVNGVEALSQGQHTSKRAGRLLTRT